jgi:hypothetical protein
MCRKGTCLCRCCDYMQYMTDRSSPHSPMIQTTYILEAKADGVSPRERDRRSLGPGARSTRARVGLRPCALVVPLSHSRRRALPDKGRTPRVGHEFRFCVPTIGADGSVTDYEI